MIVYFHILRVNNSHADALANTDASLTQGFISLNNEEVSPKPIP